MKKQKQSFIVCLILFLVFFSFSNTDYYNIFLFKGNLKGTGFFDTKGIKNTPKVKWKFQAGDRIRSTPIIVNNIVYFGTADTFFYALNAETGEVIWKYKTPGEIPGCAAYGDGVIFFMTSSKVFALNALTGEKKWKSDYVGSISTDPVIYNGVVYFGSFEEREPPIGILFAFDLKTGKEIWKENFDTGVYSTPVISENMIFFNGGTKICAYDLVSHQKIWDVEIRHFFSSMPCIVNENIYISTEKSWIYSVNIKTGLINWESHFSESYFAMTPFSTNGDLLIFGSCYGGLFAMNPTTGQLVYEVLKEKKIQSTPVIADGMAYFGSNDKKMNCVDLKSGTLLWEFDAEGMVWGTPIISDGVLYFGDMKGVFYALY